MDKFITINNIKYDIDVAEDMPLLWFLRDKLQLTGTKFGCGKGLCGSCTVHVDGLATRSCLMPVGTLAEREITTIEGLSENADHPLQKAWLEVGVPQCGYCQAGQIMNAAGLLNQNSSPTEKDIELGMAGNICRCGTYQRIKKAIQIAANELVEEES